jgi:ABC-2 type transport system permease protein
MHKYINLFFVTWQNGLVYRLSVLLWRLRQFLTTLMGLTVWSVIFANQEQVLNYSGSEMITYIFLVGILQSLILASILNGLAQTIYSGNLSYELLKPVNIFAYLGVQDLADKAKNFLFILLETAILFFLFKPSVVVPDVATLGIFSLWIIGGIIINFWISLLFGSLGFWSPETWGPRFLFFMFLDFTAGRLFPLDILPKFIQNIVFVTPFPYFSFVQTQLFLGKLSSMEVLRHSLVMTAWIIGLGLLVKVIWSRGLKDYAAAGR